MTQMGTDKSRNMERSDEQTGVIIGAAMEVHRQLGHGFLERVYQEALAVEFVARGVPFEREVELVVNYKAIALPCTYKADFVCHQSIIVELKALAALGGVEQAQVINYLKATGLRRGLLLNFGSTRLEIKRLVFDAHLTQQTNPPSAPSLSVPHLCPSVPSVDYPHA